MRTGRHAGGSADAKHTPAQQEGYVPPPAHACNVVETLLDLVEDLDSGTRHELYHRANHYRENVVDFCLEQLVIIDDPTAQAWCSQRPVRRVPGLVPRPLGGEPEEGSAMLSEERKAATKAALRAIAKYQASKDTPPGLKQGVTTVIAVEDELVDDVFSRVTAHEAPVILAVYFPKTERVQLMTLQPESGPAPDDLVRTNCKSTIGMIVDAGSHISAPQQWQEVFEARKLDIDLTRT